MTNEEIGETQFQNALKRKIGSRNSKLKVISSWPASFLSTWL